GAAQRVTRRVAPPAPRATRGGRPGSYETLAPRAHPLRWRRSRRYGPAGPPAAISRRLSASPIRARPPARFPPIMRPAGSHRRHPIVSWRVETVMDILALLPVSGAFPASGGDGTASGGARKYQAASG